MVLINGKRTDKEVYSTLFPSPCGDYGSYQKMGYKAVSLHDEQFPSPCGDYGSYPTNCFMNCMSFTKVSVPLRGLWFLSNTLKVKSNRAKMRFPSPCGDYGSYRRYGTCCYCSFKFKVSVPLRGLWFLSATPCRLAQIYPMPCFRPLAGIMVLINANAVMTRRKMAVVSVPLRGLWFLSVVSSCDFNKTHKHVSVPLRGLWFLSGRR